MIEGRQKIETNVLSKEQSERGSDNREGKEDANTHKLILPRNPAELFDSHSSTPPALINLSKCSCKCEEGTAILDCIFHRHTTRERFQLCRRNACMRINCRGARGDDREEGGGGTNSRSNKAYMVSPILR